MGGRYWTVLTIVLVASSPLVVNPQSGPEATQNFKFSMDSTKDCNGPVYNVFDREVVIHGQSSGSVQSSPLSCTIRLATENNFEKSIFRVTVRAMKIEDQDVRLTIYDGEPGNLMLDSYSIGSTPRPERVTTGNKVSFVLTRRDERNTKYDIEIVAKPLIAGQEPGYGNDWGNDYGFFNRLVPNSVIYGIVGGLFFIIVVVIIIVAVMCHRKHKGLNKKPDQYKISYIANNNPNLSRGPNSEASTKTWVTTSRNSLGRRERKHHNRDDDSVFNDSEDSYSNKRRYDQDRSYENTNYQNRKKEDRYNSRPSYRNNSFVQADDDHPQDTYIQREMSPRVKTRRTYEPEEEEDEESVGVGPDEEEEEELSEEEEKETEEEETEEEETEEEEEEVEPEDGDSGGIQQPPPQYLPEHPPPRLGHQPMSGIPQPAPRHLPPHDQPHSYPTDPRQMPVTRPYGPQYMVYPGQPRPQFMPMAPGPGQFQPIQTLSRPPPPYQGKASQEPHKPYQVKPSDPPIYSYLVQRGYNPEDGRDSPVSVSTNASAKSDTRLIQPEDSDLSAHNLDAGVEYMRR